MIIVKNEPIFYATLVVIALLHIIFARIASKYDSKIYQTRIDDDQLWLESVKPYMEMSTSLMIASLLLVIIFMVTLILVYGFIQALLPTFCIISATIVFGIIDEKKYSTLYSKDEVIKAEERFIKLMAIIKENKKNKK